MYIKDSTDGLVLKGNRIFASNGGIGDDGESGVSGQPGTNGSAGSPSFSQNRPGSCTTAILNSGANGGQNVCGGTSAAGGRGGGARCPSTNREEEDGQDGAPANVGGDGGEGATASTVSSPGLCTIGTGGLDAFPGSAGSAGADGVGVTEQHHESVHLLIIGVVDRARTEALRKWAAAAAVAVQQRYRHSR